MKKAFLSEETLRRLEEETWALRTKPAASAGPFFGIEAATYLPWETNHAPPQPLTLEKLRAAMRLMEERHGYARDRQTPHSNDDGASIAIARDEES